MPRLLIEISEEAWPKLLACEYYAARQCAAMSVGFMPLKDVFQFAQEQAAGHLFEHPQYQAYEGRLQAIEIAIQNREIPDLQPAVPDAANPVRWIGDPNYVPLVPFVSWAKYQKWELPAELESTRSAWQKTKLENKYRFAIPNISTLFSNQKFEAKKPGACKISLKEAAHYPSRSERGAWDEYAMLIWLKQKGALQET